MPTRPTKYGMRFDGNFSETTLDDNPREALEKAANFAIHQVVKDPQVLKSTKSAGFIVGEDDQPGNRDGYQIFVSVARWSEKERNPENCGLHVPIA